MALVEADGHNALNLPVARAYRAAVDNGSLEQDPAQLMLARALDGVLTQISRHHPPSKSNSLGWLFARRRAQIVGCQGLYIYGKVGRGKTMLMDMFFDLVPETKKRRAHFNDFMADVHERIHAERRRIANGEAKGSDPIPPVASSLFSQAWILCFDEFAVTDIADAMLLSRLFEQLFAKGCFLVATSNVAPDDLYRDGLNRGLFLPFVKLLKHRVRVFDLDAHVDYRLTKAAERPVYLTPLNTNTAAAFENAWATRVLGLRAAPDALERKGRRIEVPCSAGRIARFHFDDLCRKPLAAADYLALADRYDTFFINDVPVFHDDDRNAAKRFILLVDTLYDRQARLVMSAAAEPDALMKITTGTEPFEFARTASRLSEMRSHAYAQAASRQDEPVENLA